MAAGDAKVVKRALRGVRAVICPGKLGTVIQAAAQQGVEHIVLLSAGRCCLHYLCIAVLYDSLDCHGLQKQAARSPHCSII